MCGRAHCSLDPSRIQRLTRSNGPWKDGNRYHPSFNIAPGSYLPVLKENRMLNSMLWGFSHQKLINARAETLDKLPTFSRILSNRCVILCEGFYEWEDTKLGTKQPYYLHPGDGSQLMALAGLYNVTSGTSIPHIVWSSLLQCEGPNGQEEYSFVIITVESPEKFAWIHHRMPAVLSDDQIDIWLNPHTSTEQALQLLKPDSNLDFYPVTKRVGNAAFDTSDCIKPAVVRKSNQPTIDQWMIPPKEEIKQENSYNAIMVNEPVQLKPELSPEEDNYWKEALPEIERQLMNLKDKGMYICK